MIEAPPATHLSSNAPPPADERLRQALDWASSQLQRALPDCVPVSADASFRRYFRLRAGGESLILMDAPPEREDSRPFLDVARRLRAGGVHAPEVLHFDLERGFGLLEDLGDTLYRDVLSARSADRLFPGLFSCLHALATRVDCTGLPEYDNARLQQELDLFTDWYLLRHRRVSLTPAERTVWTRLCEELLRSASEQPRVFVHRDFHSCNLLLLDRDAPGVIDFQDAVRGPLSYDFVSLIWDRYIAWPRPRLEAWMEDIRSLLEVNVEPHRWQRWCDLMGLQRNLKVVGIFARLNYRDGKAGYLDLVPRFHRYVLDVLARYPEFAAASDCLREPRCAP